MIDTKRRQEKDQEKEKVRRRMRVEIDPDNYEYIPAKKPIDYYDNEIPQRVAIYVRVSTDDVRQTTSYELQKKYYEDFVRRHPNWSLVKIYADEGISGTSLKHRDAFNEMIEHCRAGKIDLIITKSVSRFARNVMITIGMARELAQMKSPVGIFFESEAIFSLNDDSQMALTFQATMAEEESHTRSRSMETSLRMRLDTMAAEQDNDFAAYRLGKLYLGGEGVLKDVASAIRWLTFATDRKNQFAEYALGNLYLKGEDMPQDIPKALEYLKRSAVQGNQFAQYRLGKLYLMDEDVKKDIPTALQFLIAAAEQNNQYAQYTLGKLYLMGKDVPRDKDTAVRWLTLSAAQGNLYAQFFLDHMDDFREPSALLAGTRLLHHMSRIFSDNAPTLKTSGQRTDRKLLRKLREKKQAQGHARDDHEQNMSL